MLIVNVRENTNTQIITNHKMSLCVTVCTCVRARVCVCVCVCVHACVYTYTLHVYSHPLGKAGPTCTPLNRGLSLLEMTES